MKIAALLGLVAPVLSSPAAPFNTPSPMLPGAYTNCEGFFLASPGVTCASIAASYFLSLEEFLRINPQIQLAGGCESGGMLAHYWYCIKPWDGPFPTRKIAVRPSPTTTTINPGRIANGPLSPTSTRPQATTTLSMVRTFTTRLVDGPRTTAASETCQVDACFRAFLRIVPPLEAAHRRFCSQLVDGPCTARSMEDLNAPAVIANECPQDQPCAPVASACACYLDGAMDGKLALA